MSRPIIIAIIACVCLVSAYFVITLPSRADKTFRKHLETMGFDAATLPEPEKRLHAIRYRDVSFDSEERSAIDAITLEYSLPELLLKGKIDTITLNGVYLSGTFDRTETLTIEGIDKLSPVFSAKKNRFNDLSIKNATLSLLTAQLGGVRIMLDAHLQHEEDGYAITGNIESKQSQFEFFSKLQGKIAPGGAWTADFDIQGAKLERSTFKVTRASGMARLIGTGLQTEEISTQIRAGALTLADTPWQNANITANGAPKDLSIFVEAKSGGNIQDLELSIESLRRNKHFEWSGRVFAPQTHQLKTYLESIGKLPFNASNFPTLSTGQTPSKTLFKEGKNGLIFMHKNLETEEKFTGRIEVHQTAPGEPPRYSISDIP